MRRSLTLLTLLGLAVAVTAPLAARADVIDGTYDFTMVPNTTRSGVATGPTGSGSFTITGAGYNVTVLGVTYTFFSGSSELTSLDFNFNAYNPASGNSESAVDFTLGNAVNGFTPSITFDSAGYVSNIGYEGDSNQTTLSVPTGYFNSLTYDLTYADNTDPSGTINVDNTPISPVPEPSTLALFGSGLLGLAFTLRRKLKLQKDTPSWDGLVA